jgi:glyoxylase-like metal-dependent hydrolase (beta-lactamase superfamily II)
MGGKEVILAVRTLVLEGEGEALYTGQTMTPDARTNFRVPSFRRSYDFAGRRWLQDYVREWTFLSPPPPAFRTRQGIDGTIGYTIADNGSASRVAASAAADRAAELLYHPVGFLQAAFAPDARVTETVDSAGPRIELRDGATTFTMLVDPGSGLPTSVSRVTDHPMLGDAVVRVEHSDWRQIDALRLPMRTVQHLGPWVVADYRARTATANAEAANLTAPDSIRSATAPSAPRGPIELTAEEVAPGVWILGEGVYHSIAIEQSNRIVLIEAPENDALTLATIAKARTLRPGKPVGPVVNTHAHFDHAGGVRAAISEGLAVVTHEANRDFFEHLVYPARHTLQPDALERSPHRLELVAVRDRLVLADALRTVELYAVTGSQHAHSMLLAYVPAARIVVQADLDSPPGPNGAPAAQPFTPGLVETVSRHGLQVDRVLGIHGRPMVWPKG